MAVASENEINKHPVLNIYMGLYKQHRIYYKLCGQHEYSYTLGKDSADIWIPKEAAQAAYNERMETYYD